VTATAGCGSIAVSWTDVGASSYVVLTSTTGPNSGFSSAASTGATSATINAALNQTEWIRVEAIGANGAISSMSCAMEVTDTLGACVCITDLTIQAKATIAELDWPLVEGAASYNVYRSTAPGVLLIPGNRIATGVGTVNGIYTDGGLIDGRTYYYVVTSVVNGVETCESIEVHGTPAAVVR
jgi:fibronectin type 3 domain-containing protein